MKPDNIIIDSKNDVIIIDFDYSKKIYFPNMISINNNTQIKNANQKELPHIINKLEKYESIYKISDKYKYEEPIERSFLQYFLGYIYYYGEYASINIYKAITKFEKSSNQKL